MTDSTTPARILVVEDDPAHAEVVQHALEREGLEVEVAHSAEAALDRLGARSFDLVLADVRLGARSGLELMREVHAKDPDLAVVLMTGHGTVENAVQALRDGAADYLVKPIHLEELRTRVARALEKRRLHGEVHHLRAQLEQRSGLAGIVGASPAMQQVFDLVRQAAPTEATVLVLGESGTGKELVARALHGLSRRADKRFVAINCAAMTETLIESELFGHAKGAFTGAHEARDGKFAYADGGTLFLDEIGDMPLATQAKLLRVLEDREVVPVGANTPRPVDVRILAATNQDLQQRVRDGKFREDLFYRLAVLTIELPPLRERLEDLPLLVDHFRIAFSEQHGKVVASVDPEVLRKLVSWRWPGNVRELRNVVETMVVLDRDGRLGVDDLPLHLRDLEPGELPPLALLPPGESAAESGESGGAAASDTAGAETEGDAERDGEGRAEADGAERSADGAGGYRLLGKTLEEVERDLIAVTLEAVGGNRREAARRLGMGERTLYRKIKEYGLP